jgi:hypothetical protein
MPRNNLRRSSFWLKGIAVLRIQCNECLVMFDLQIVGMVEIEDDPEPIDDARPASCPYCGSAEIKPLHDMPASIPRVGRDGR